MKKILALALLVSFSLQAISPQLASVTPKRKSKEAEIIKAVCGSLVAIFSAYEEYQILNAMAYYGAVTKLGCAKSVSIAIVGTMAYKMTQKALNNLEEIAQERR
jgi:hypothetical protein